MQSLVVGWVNVIPALGEERGWRGWLLPQLLPLGRWPGATTGLLGWTGWVVMAVVAAFLRPRSPAAPAPLGPGRARPDSGH